MAFSTDQLNKLEAAIAQGALTVRLNNRLITYHSLGEMIRLRDTMRAELGIAAPAATRSRFVTLATGKGL